MSHFRQVMTILLSILAAYLPWEDADDDLDLERDLDLDLETVDKEEREDELLLSRFLPFFLRSRERPLSGDDSAGGAAADGDTPLFLAVLFPPEIFCKSPSKSSMAYLVGDRRCCGERSFTLRVFSLEPVLEFHTRLILESYMLHEEKQDDKRIC